MRQPSGSQGRAALLAVVLTGAAPATASPAAAALSADLQNVSMPTVAHSHQEQTVTSRAMLTVTDTSSPLQGDNKGWQVTTQASDLRYSGLHAGSTIPARHLSVVSLETPVASTLFSEAVDPYGGPKIPATPPTGPLDAPRSVLEAQPGHGYGAYTQGLVLSLTLPPGARTGTYTGTITTTISPALTTTAGATAEPTATTQPEPDPATASAPAAPVPAPTASPEPTSDSEPQPTTAATPAPTASPDPALSTTPAP